ncbi:thioredoxin fold domain-containing protein [Desulfatiferula olefinivorans]
MKHVMIALFFVFSALLVPGHVHEALSAETISWHSYDDGMARAKAEQKKVYINFHADWCGYCHKMERETFKDGQVIAYLNKNYIPVRIDSDKQKDLARKYRVRGLPDHVFVAETGETIGNQPGYLGPRDFMKVITFVYEEQYKTGAK